MRFTITLFALSLFFIYSVYAIHISEVHPYPEGGEEWVEIFINESINITELQVSDNYQTDRVTCCGENCTETIAGPGYFILTAADSNHSYGCSRVCVDDKSIGNGLGNEWDNISLLYRGNITESFLYNWTIKGRSVILTEGEYIQVLPTPCESNALSMLLLNRTRYNLGEVLEFIIEGYGLNVSAELNLSSQNMSQLYLIPLSELNYLLVNETGNYTLGIVVDTIQRNYSFEIISEEIIEQDCVFSITMDSHIFEVGDQVSFDLQVEFCNITYWIEDSGGRQAKAPYTTHTSGVKKFTPDNGGGYILYATSGKETKELYFIVKENISAESAIFVALKNESYVFGKPISVSLQVHKGDTGKTAIYLYVQDEEKISETVILHIDKKFTELDVTVPVLLDEKCGLPSSEYT
ncbi:MAG: hypothetical protein HGA85_08645, partial [Nanoarchaeota archaeon]|nr:hypothetical protein [Nanoarchaeota archaeon]